jgi:asparagine synthase (glutamine-hydrolysing)
MCGIAGIVNLNPNETVDELVLKRMRDVIRHRGPDGEGLWIDGPVGLAHRRLAIVDLVSGQQPMTNEDGSCWITFNGEIYNHAALRPGLEAAGHRYRTRSDTETILHQYEEDGERCVERLQGMFAFAIWDRAEKRLLLARDRLGIKPVYYALTGRELLFASEIKALLAATSLRPAFNERILPEYLATRFVSGEETFFKGIRKLLPGRTMTWTLDEGLRTRRYWQLPGPSEEPRASMAERAEGVRAALGKAVRSHLMSDVPLGLFLSGGIDSSALAALMAPMVSQPIQTFSVGFDDPRANELAYARMMARAVGATHREIVVSPAQFFDALPRLVWHEDEPIATPASVPLYFVSKLARDHVTVVLTGEGSDELLLGYNKYRVTAWNERLGRTYRGAVPGPVRDLIGGAIARAPRRIGRYASRSFLMRSMDPRALFYENFAPFTEAAQRSLLADPSLLGHDPYADSLAHYHGAPGGTVDRMSHADLQTYLVELLMKQDQMSMATSIESRVPFLDHEFVEHVASMPARFKLSGVTTKAVLRRALRGIVPAAILSRRKMGFPVPLGGWFAGPFRRAVDDFVLGERARGRGLFAAPAVSRLVDEHLSGIDRGTQIWLLVNLEIWHRIFLDGEDPAAITCGIDERSRRTA